jgi:propionyl-CoA carboxylase beta chain
MNFAWPTAEIAVMGSESAVGLLYKEQLQRSGEPELERERLRVEYEHALCHPYVAAERGYVDFVIRPRDTRSHIAAALRMLRSKRSPTVPRKHGNIPL